MPIFSYNPERVSEIYRAAALNIVSLIDNEDDEEDVINEYTAAILEAGYSIIAETTGDYITVNSEDGIEAPIGNRDIIRFTVKDSDNTPVSFSFPVSFLYTGDNPFTYNFLYPYFKTDDYAGNYYAAALVYLNSVFPIIRPAFRFVNTVPNRADYKTFIARYGVNLED